jgi:hypothetical protein
MSIGPLGLSANVSGTPLAQTKGSEVDRARQQTDQQSREIDLENKAEAAAGVGEPDCEDHETAERDADGNRPWEEDLSESEENPAKGKTPKSKDPTRERGNLLDLTG